MCNALATAFSDEYSSLTISHAFFKTLFTPTINDSCSHGSFSSTKVLMFVFACCRITRISESIVLLGMLSALDISVSLRPWQYRSITLDLRTRILSFASESAFNMLVFHPLIFGSANILLYYAAV